LALLVGYLHLLLPNLFDDRIVIDFRFLLRYNDARTSEQYACATRSALAELPS
jgi:hypothetical protein